MKNKILKSVVIIFTIVICQTSCSKKDDNANMTTPPVSNSHTWKMGSYSYTRGTSAGGSSANEYQVLVISTSEFNNANGLFSGSSITFGFYGNAVGTYTIKSFETVGSAHVNSPTLKYISVNVVVGSQSPNTNLFLSQDSEVNANVTFVDGKYHVTIANPAVLNKSSIDTGTGISGVPNTFNFTCNDVF